MSDDAPVLSPPGIATENVSSMTSVMSLFTIHRRDLYNIESRLLTSTRACNRSFVTCFLAAMAISSGKSARSSSERIVSDGSFSLLGCVTASMEADTFIGVVPAPGALGPRETGTGGSDDLLGLLGERDAPMGLFFMALVELRVLPVLNWLLGVTGVLIGLIEGDRLRFTGFPGTLKSS